MAKVRNSDDGIQGIVKVLFMNACCKQKTEEE